MENSDLELMDQVKQVPFEMFDCNTKKKIHAVVVVLRSIFTGNGRQFVCFSNDYKCLKVAKIGQAQSGIEPSSLDCRSSMVTTSYYTVFNFQKIKTSWFFNTLDDTD